MYVKYAINYCDIIFIVEHLVSTLETDVRGKVSKIKPYRPDAW